MCTIQTIPPSVVMYKNPGDVSFVNFVTLQESKISIAFKSYHMHVASAVFDMGNF